MPRRNKIKNPAVRRRLQRAEKYGASGYFLTESLNDKLKAYRRRCYYCFKKFYHTPKGKPLYHADHFIPLAEGGSNYAENIVLACPKCDVKKADMLPWEFKEDEGERPKPPEEWVLQF